MRDLNDVELDALLRDAMAARPEPDTGADVVANAGPSRSAQDLAARVMAMAHADGATAGHTAAERAANENAAFVESPRQVVRPRVSIWPTVAAAVAMVAVIAVGVARLMALGDSSAAADSALNAAASDSIALLPAGGIGLMAILAWVTARGAFQSRDDRYPDAAFGATI